MLRKEGCSSDAARRAVLAVPLAVPASMAGVFALLARRCRPQVAYNVGFAMYWVGWCLAFPLWVLGPRRAVDVLTRGRRPTLGEAALLALPVAGSVATRLLPRRDEVDARVGGMMVVTAAVNAVGEELLWRGAFVEEFPDDPWRGAVWPLLGFAVWHLAPQVILPSRIGRLRFILGSALVGTASTLAAWREGGLRWVLAPHAATDACGVTAALFRLGR